MEKYSKTKRIITPIEIIYRSGKDIMKLSNSTHFQSVIMEDAFKSIKEAINKKWKKVELFIYCFFNTLKSIFHNNTLKMCAIR